MNYIIKTKGKSIIKISEEEYGKLRQVESGLVHFRNISIDIISIDSIIPEEDYILEKSNQTTGMLHDGQAVIKKFGVWYINDGSFQIVVDPKYYPEVERDVVPTVKEFEQKYKHLSPAERLKEILPKKEEVIDNKKLEEYKRLKVEGFKK